MNTQKRNQMIALAAAIILGICAALGTLLTENYNQYANECASPSLMNEFMNLLSEEHQIQHEVFTELQKRGWYPTQEAPAEKVQQAKLKFSNPS